MIKSLLAICSLLTVFLLLGLMFSCMAWASIPSGDYREPLAALIGFGLSFLLLNIGTPKPPQLRGFVL